MQAPVVSGYHGFDLVLLHLLQPQVEVVLAGRVEARLRVKTLFMIMSNLMREKAP